MTAVHFLHQTDIGLALRKHEAIYGNTPTLFSLSLSLPLPPVFAFALCKHELHGERVTRYGQTRPFLPRHRARFVSFSLRLATASIPPTPLLHSPPSTGLSCWIFDRGD